MAVTIKGVSVGVVVTMLGCPVVSATDVSRIFIALSVAIFSAVGVLATTIGVGVRVATNLPFGVAVAVPVVVASIVAWLANVAAMNTSLATGVGVTIHGVPVDVAVTIAGVPVVAAMAVSCSAITSAVALFCAVGVLVTTIGVGVFVASSILRGVGVAVPVIVAAQ